ncbi:MAG: phosphoglycerate dehydrogenase [Gammaproteobacteria bacterium]|nr:MAG: phosphoglycerate dehydrogenase [Gammaproteobacteria bacterium]
MFKIQTLNNISNKGLERLPDSDFETGDDIKNPDAILLRSYKMHDMEIPKSLLAVGRAGAGVNNIPVDKMSARGIPVFNAPGANANAVKELVVAGLLLACRNICPAWEFSRNLEGKDDVINKAVETGKKNYAGFELPGRTLGVVGLGAIGRSVANIALQLGMKVVGYDPGLTVEGAWQLSAAVNKASSVDNLLRQVDFITFHVPLIDATKNIINTESLGLMRDGVTILNFARNGIVDDQAVMQGLETGKVHAYVCDFPNNLIKDHPRVIALPHLGASTREAEENCAIMVANQVMDYLLNGNIRNSVNFPEVIAPRESDYRMVIANANVPNMLGQISTAMANAELNIHDMVNRSRGELAYTVVDVDSAIPDTVKDEVSAIDGVTMVRII